MKAIVAFISGVLFSVGLTLGGMTNPDNILSFFDFFGNWNYSLMFVMGGGVAVYAAFYWLTQKREKPLFDSSYYIPKNKTIDEKLVTGAALFGIGWGIGGFCPGPAIVSTFAAQKNAFIFVIAMGVGMFLHQMYETLATKSPSLNKLSFDKEEGTIGG